MASEPSLHSVDASGPESGSGSVHASTNSSSADSRADATFIAPPGSGLDMLVGGSKQERDLAFAVAVVNAGAISERDLAKAVASWTVHGAETLADRLLRKEWISLRDAELATTAAARQLDALARSEPRSAGDRGRSEMARLRVQQLDPSGRLTRMLGLAVSTSFADVPEFRQIASRFTLVRKLGEGGLGVVWLARDENLNRYVAVKEIKHGGQEDAAAVARFRREAELTGRLEHPGIVPIYQFGQDVETGRYFYVMRFLGKQTLADGIREYHERREAGHDNPMLLHRLLNSFVSLCHAVSHAHELEIVHRDLKPENVALDGLGKAILLDWGLARLTNETGVYDASGRMEPADVLESTLSGQVVGTPMYMAPEQASGRAEEVDERTDVYGLGGVLFAILTGAAPHESTTGNISTRSPLSEMLAAIVEKPLPHPRSLVPAIAPELEAICMKALEKKRFLRYPTAVALAEDIERFMAGAKVEAYDPPLSRRAARWISDHPHLSKALGLLLLVLLVSGVTLGVVARQTQLVVRQARFEVIRDVVDELRMSMQSQADQLVKNVRFVGGLPSTAMVVQSIQQVEQDAAGETPESTQQEQNDVKDWEDRLGSVFAGVMQGYPEYRVTALVQLVDGRARELIRYEQNESTGTVMRMPPSRLTEFTPGSFSRELAGMLPGEVLLTMGHHISTDAPARDRSALTLIAATPLFREDTAELFGFAVIEMNLARLVKTQLPSLSRGLDVYLTDDSGKVQLYFERGTAFSRRYDGQRIESAVPVAAALFKSREPAAQVDQDGRIYGIRLPLNPTNPGPDCDVGIVAVEPESSTGGNAR